MNLNPPPIESGWAIDSKLGPVPVWALWFQNVWLFLNGGASGNLTIAAGAGSITSYTATYRYTKIGSFVVLIFDITITNAGTGSGDLNITIPNKSASVISGSAREMVSGVSCSCTGASGATTFGVRKYDNTTIIVTGNHIVGHVNYFV